MDQMFQMQERDRPSAEECLQHEWLNQEHGDEKLDTALQNLKKYVARRKWVRSINAVRAVTRLQSGLKALMKGAKAEAKADAVKEPSVSTPPKIESTPPSQEDRNTSPKDKSS